jgi:hypothetical protein
MKFKAVDVEGNELQKGDACWKACSSSGSAWLTECTFLTAVKKQEPVNWYAKHHLKGYKDIVMADTIKARVMIKGGERASSLSGRINSDADESPRVVKFNHLVKKKGV